MNWLVMATEILKFESTPSCSLMEMKSMISGCVQLKMPMFAPRRVPPCLTVSVATSNTRMNDKGPLETPFVDLTMSFFGRIWENEKPVPPPLLWMRAVYLTDSNISSMESPTGSTKHAESCPSSLPAFISVGELGRKSRSVMTL